MFLLIFILIKNKQTKPFKIQEKKGNIAESQANPQANLEANLILNALLVIYSHFPSNENSFFQMQNVRHMAKHVLNKVCYPDKPRALIHEQSNFLTTR